ncbi:hypothetical protein TUM12370_06520 [Salmonella enterica subsp. enterica serovar Choleraesuis]|nr:hypothetical protein TUM12370_06520 [Salmonella enterica subsp. enterica serovar Choleraesuis]
MMFSIEDAISFEPNSAQLVNLITDDCVELSLTACRLLTELLQHRETIITRNELFLRVFENHGAKATNSNLNQYISTLRKSLLDLGIEKEVIITIPRVGFKISEDVNISCQTLLDVEKPAPPQNTGLRKKQKMRKLLFLSMFVIGLSGLLFILRIIPGDVLAKHPIAHSTALTHNQCTIYLPTGLNLEEALMPFNDTPFHAKALDCSVLKRIYIHQRKIHGSLGTNASYSLIECNIKTGQCSSYYARKKTYAQ